MNSKQFNRQPATNILAENERQGSLKERGKNEALENVRLEEKRSAKDCLLLTAHFSLLTAYCSLLTV